MRRIIALSFTIILAILSQASAGWWIFGQGVNEVKINYLYLCGASLDETGPKVKIPRSNLKDGLALVKGRASVRKGAIGAVQVSLTDPADWQKARLSADGSFEYSFAPEAGKIYKFSIKAMDTAGKTSDVAATEREIEFVDMDIRGEIIKALDALIAAYQAENPAAFMAYVSPDFAGDAAILDTAVRKDFSAFSDIRLAYTLSGIASGEAAKTSAAINFRRQVISAKDGKPYSDSGTTEFVFRQGEKGFQVYSMKNPLIFGLSLASDVGTGTTTQGPDNVDIIVITGPGNVTTVPPGTVTEPYTPIMASANITLSPGTPPQGIFFETGFVVLAPANPDMRNSPGDNQVNFRPAAGAGIVRYKAIPACSGISNVTTVDTYTNGYVSPVGPLAAVSGACYSVYLPSGKYAAFEVTGLSPLTIRYKYQPDGSTQF